MRLTQRQRRVIQQAARRIFGPDAQIKLFGSRLDDQARGGDFDLHVETSEADPERLVASRLAFLHAVHADLSLEDEKIDVIVQSPLHSARPIDQVAKQDGVEL